MRYLSILIALLTWTACSTLLATNGVSEIGVGAKAKGMGGVGIALPQDALISAVNPAGIALQPNRLDIGFGWTWQNGATQEVGEAQSTTRNSNQALWFPEAGITWEFCPCQVVGLALTVYGSLDTKYDFALPTLGITPPSSELYYILLTPSWAWRITCNHAVGIAVNVALAESEASGLENFIANSAFPSRVTNKGTNYQEGVSFRIGWIGQITPCFCLGATLQTPTWTCRFRKYMGLFVNGGEVNLPPEAGVGAALQLCGCWTLAGDLLYRFWKNSDQFDHRASASGTFLTGFGQANGPGFGWHNQVVARLGLAWQPLPNITLRAGYNYSNQPIPDDQTLLNQLTLATVVHHATAGGTWSWGCNEVTLYFYHGFDRQVKGENSTLSNAEINLRNVQNAAGIEYGRRF